MILEDNWRPPNKGAEPLHSMCAGQVMLENVCVVRGGTGGPCDIRVPQSARVHRCLIHGVHKDNIENPKANDIR